MKNLLIAGVSLLVCMLLFSGCKTKDISQPESGSPVFTVKGTLNNEPFDFSAGLSGYALATGASQNYYGVYLFDSEFQQESCDTCGPSLAIRIKDQNPLTQGDYPQLESVLLPGMLSYADGPMSSGDPFTVTFNPMSFPGATYFWNFGDGQTSTEVVPTHTYANSGVFTVRLEITRNGYTSTLEQSINVGTNDQCSDPIFFDYMGNRTWKFFGHHQHGNPWPNGNDFDEYQWLVDGVEVETSEELIYTFNGPSDEEHTVCAMRVVGPGECALAFCVKITGVPGTTPCLANFFANPLPAQNSLGTVEIVYVDANGRAYYSSEANNSPGNSSFEIISNEATTLTVGGDPTRKVTLRFSCRLHGSGPGNDFIDLHNVEATMGFVVPQP